MANTFANKHLFKPVPKVPTERKVTQLILENHLYACSILESRMTMAVKASW
jgi:hypothetical protein